jgi:hypothetical protein
VSSGRPGAQHLARLSSRFYRQVGTWRRSRPIRLEPRSRSPGLTSPCRDPHGQARFRSAVSPAQFCKNARHSPRS